MNIRPFVAEDAESVASLWQYWFKDKTRTPDQALIDLVRHIYLEDPNVDPDITSLVAENQAGKMLGFLGASVMPVVVDGSDAKMAGIFPSVVDPEASTTVATFLLRRFLAGPQVFTFSDGGHVKFERIWEGLGGQIAQMQSMRWVKLFRPVQVATPAGRSRVLRPLLSGVDRAVRALGGKNLRLATRAAAQGGFVTEPATAEDLALVTPAMQRHARLRPVYKAAHLRWQFAQMARIAEQGEFTARLVRTQSGEPAGWFVYYLKPGGVSRVFALEGHDRYLAAVTDQLMADADRRGAGALMGRMEPRLRRVIAERTPLVYTRGSLQMIHSKDPSLMHDAQLGRLAYSRLQGENWYWWALDSEEVV